MTEKEDRPEQAARLFKADSDWWHNACINFSGVDFEAYATGYKRAADFLVERASQEQRYQDTLVYPIAFLYRQYIELRLKQIVRRGKILLEITDGQDIQHHNLGPLWKTCRQIMEKISQNEDPVHFDEAENIVIEFGDIDSSSTAFRYPTDKEGNPSLPGLTHINLRILAEAIEKVSVLLDGAVLEIGLRLDQKSEMEADFGF